jgi:glycine betaine/proline transport system substrate-binding protein
MFSRWDLAYLEDPDNVYGSGGHIATIVRHGLKGDMPYVYEVLDRFSWEPEEMGQLMLWNEEDEGLYVYENALRWMRAHPDRVESWLP